MSLVLITLQAQYRSGVNAAPATGYVRITPTGWRTSVADNVIYVPEAAHSDLDDLGGLTVALENRDSSDDEPYSYRVEETVNNVRRSYDIVLPVAPDGSLVSLADVQPDGTWASADIKLGGFGGF